ncbi:hypothetical protein [Pendulispora albinea]|uniref:Uncharacterized protein n=1 Tax=Pendulispora albinea TaxID=2741071 RepID=A0ABZ2LMN5_9BACT
MQIEITRDSVAMGDDADAPHREVLEVSDGATLADAVAEVLRRPYLARIRGGKATWLIVRAPAVLAVVAEQWSAPRWLDDPQAPAPSSLHFRYLAQRDPDQVYASFSASMRRTTGR